MEEREKRKRGWKGQITDDPRMRELTGRRGDEEDSMGKKNAFRNAKPNINTRNCKTNYMMKMSKQAIHQIN